MVTQAIVLKWLIVNKKLLIFFHFSARQVSGRRFLVAHMYSALESPPYAEPWPCFSLLPLKAAQHGLVIPWGCGAATADIHRLCLWVWKDSSPFPYPASWSSERGKGSHFSDWANRDLQQNECYPPNDVPAQVLNHSGFYIKAGNFKFPSEEFRLFNQWLRQKKIKISREK